jgi:hypothetical protein
MFCYQIGTYPRPLRIHVYIRHHPVLVVSHGLNDIEQDSPHVYHFITSLLLQHVHQLDVNSKKLHAAHSDRALVPRAYRICGHVNIML